MRLGLLLFLAACKSGGDSGEDVDHGATLGVGVIPRDPTVSVGETVQLRAQVFYEDTTYDDITESVDWLAVDTRVASVGDDGVATALAEGQSDIVATSTDGTSAKVLLTVLGADVTVDTITADPAQLDLHVGDAVAVGVTAHFSDGTTGNVAGTCAWSADDEGVATAESGLVRGQGEGTTQVHASCDGGDVDVDVSVVGDEIDLPEPDLRVTYVEGVPDGGDVEFTAIVENDGDGYASSFWVDVVLDDGPPSVGDPTDAYTWVPGLAGGSSVPVYIDLYGVSTGSHDAWIVVDSEDDVVEANEGNNVSASTVVDIAGASASPNLVITEFEGISDGSYTYWYVEIQNDGDDWSAPCFIDLFPDAFYEPSVGDDSELYAYVPELAPGESASWEPDLDDGPYYYWESVVFVDSQGDVDEDDESDNLEWATVYGY